ARAAEPAKPKRLVVYTLRGTPELEGLARHVTEEILVALSKRPSLVIIGEDELKLMVAHSEERESLSSADCARADQCLARIAKAANGDLTLSGRVGKLGDSFVATLSLLDVGKNEVIASASTVVETKANLTTDTAAKVEEMLGFKGAAVESVERAPIA